MNYTDSEWWNGTCGKESDKNYSINDATSTADDSLRESVPVRQISSHSIYCKGYLVSILFIHQAFESNQQNELDFKFGDATKAQTIGGEAKAARYWSRY